ncbi:hypothetical protein [Plasticicumulans acidivorans]|uniref:Integral membrane protein DUF2282 n=1 Tax=Plasticicumulans acidivorans TaxID=886464 RepID=A0A317MYQ7_9GAMM|nr:hypothetical protein [Plasticicumulans acidivorans]PWV64674.1 hypothetical protein C7443_102326 [Plasticicumulans acidivorans]
MSHVATRSGIALAAAAAALFSAGLFTTSAAHAGEGTVKCAGINSCKGTSECASATNACKGQNSCKGQGWLGTKSASECTSHGGKVL